MDKAVVVAFSLIVLIVIGIIAALRELRDLPASRKWPSLLFPFSQILIVSFIYIVLYSASLPVGVYLVVFAASVACAVSDYYLFEALRIADEQAVLEEQTRLLEEQVQAQRSRERSIVAQRKRARASREHLVTQLNCAAELLEAGAAREDADDALDLASHAVESVNVRRQYCAHPMVDALVSSKALTCEGEGIRFDARIALPQHDIVPSADLCAILANVLDNAIAACRQLPEEERWVSMKSRVDGGFLLLSVDNSCPKDLSYDRVPRRSVRKMYSDEHGWGLMIVDSVTRKHDGAFDFSIKEGVCWVTAALKADR